MFNQSSDRVDYGELLSIYPDYELDQAVGLTYSLDMEALLGIPICLEMHNDMNNSSKTNPLYVLEAIRRIKKKLSIFCNVGCIKVPQKESKLYALLEDTIHEVRMPNKSNFHPKLWVLKYHNINNKNEKKIKIIVLSRNLTFDQSLDVAVNMEGKVGTNNNSKNQPLVDLITFVSQFDKSNKNYKELCNDIINVDKFDTKNEFEDYNFYPFGIYGKKDKQFKWIPSKNKIDPMDLFKNCHSLFVVSPFLTENIITDMLTYDNTKLESGPLKRCLITREKSITKNIFDGFNFRNGKGVWTVNPALCSNDDFEDDGLFGQENRDIHAKIYYVEKYNEPNKLYIGSLNASKNAFYHNVEFLVELSYKKWKISFDAFFKDIIGDINKSPFFHNDVFVKPEEDDEEPIDFRDEIYSIESASVSADGDETYSIIIKSNNNYDDVTIKPFFSKNDIQRLSKEVVFKGLPIDKLSNLFLLTKKNKDCLVRLEVMGIPTEERENALFNDIISNKASLMAYMKYLLDEDYDADSLGELFESHSGDENISDEYSFLYEKDLYENMLKASVIHPERIDYMCDVIDKIDSNKIDEEFKKLIDLFKNIRRKK